MEYTVGIKEVLILILPKDYDRQCPKNSLYTGWRSLRDRSAMKQKWPTIIQRMPSDRQDLSMVCQWSSSDLHGLFQSPKKSLNGCQGKRSLNERSTNAQGVLSDFTDLPMISQRSFNECQIYPPWRIDGWEINECTRISHRNSFFVAFERLSQFVIAQPYPSCVKGPLLILSYDNY